MRRRELDALCIAHGHRSARTIETIHIVKIRDDKAETPDAANNLVKTLRHMFSAAVEGGLLPSNPAAGVKKLTTGGEGHHTWTMKEVEAFELVHPLGTMPRLALALLLYTGQRRSDVIRMGPQHIRDGHIVITQAKNARRNPVTVQIPIISALQEALDAMPGGHLAFLTTAYGRPFSPAGFGIRFREWCNKAGLIHCSAHGLRKAALTRLAELGASELEMAAISGHRDLNQLRPYTRAARQRVLAGHAMALFEEHLSNKNVPPKSEVRRSGTFSVRKALKSLTR
ncbi:tyrosine-type recombinase/integrase [Nitrospirillum bahiense]|uniref:tyrosine-type recombinase/integrase n=1 Tax=Nitrospirillum amazonense TaxID=28077 RepID=UPI001B3B9AA6|nr:tyrosine-type recombinase/integrase [Nitrospirillum amazonense]